MHQPFVVLKEWVRQGQLRLSQRRETELSASVMEGDRELSDVELFEAAVQGVRRLDWNDRTVRAPEPLEMRPAQDETAALHVLEEFCRSGRLETHHTREYVEHLVDPAGRIYLDDLRAGHFAIQAHLDLHGLNVKEARREVDAFLRNSVHMGHFCVRIVHGRGRHSRGARPIIKEHVERWLRHRRLARFVIAYTSARIVDGGGGAVYVLLRRRER